MDKDFVLRRRIQRIQLISQRIENNRIFFLVGLLGFLAGFFSGWHGLVWSGISLIWYHFFYAIYWILMQRKLIKEHGRNSK